MSSAIAPAHAADPFGDVLRGSVEPPRAKYIPGEPVSFRWEGLYFGAQLGRTASKAKFTDGVTSLVDYILRNNIVGDHVRNWDIMMSRANSAIVNTYGGFIGYNWQFEESVVGLEFNYNRINVTHSVSDGLARTFPDDSNAPANHHFFYTATVSGASTVTLSDYGTVRARAGWELGRMLPYAFVGLGIARGTITRSATVAYTRTDIPDVTNPVTPQIADATFGPETRSETLSNRFFFGYAAGLGIDVAVLPNVIVRGEWELIQFKTLPGADIRLNTVRAAVGLRF